jgi:mutual gliding-motility protein MglA
MVLFNYATKEITAKIVYYGPGLCGKTTNLQFVFDSLPSNNKSKMLSLATKTDRTLFFDFLPLDLGKIRGMRTKLQLYTVPGQVYYNSTRQLVLKGADGLVFVADSQDFALDANLESLQNLEDNLKRQGVRIREMPIVMQFNKRDLPNALPVPKLNASINKHQSPFFESVATTGIGVEETLKGVTQLVLSHLVRKYNLSGSEPLDKDIQILNVPTEAASPESLWEEGEEPAAGATTIDGRIPLSTVTEGEFEMDDANDDTIPLVPTELIAPAPQQQAQPEVERGPFEEATDYFSTPGTPPLSPPLPSQIPMASIEIPLPAGILDSLPMLDDEPLGPLSTAAAIAPTATERRATDGLVKEISIPINLSLEELRNHRRLRLKITLDVNLLT